MIPTEKCEVSHTETQYAMAEARQDNWISTVLFTSKGNEERDVSCCYKLDISENPYSGAVKYWINPWFFCFLGWSSVPIIRHGPYPHMLGESP